MKLKIRRLDRSGDTTLLEVDTDNRKTLREAEKFLQQQRRSGYLPYTVDSDGTSVMVLNVRDAERDIYLTPARAGG